MTPAISVRKKDIGLQSVQTDKNVKQVAEEIQVKIRVIIVKKKDIGLQNALKKNNRSKKMRGVQNRKKKKRYPPQRKNPGIFRKRQ